MNFGELVDLTGYILNFNDTQTDQDFSSKRLKQTLNLVYTSEINKAKQEGGKDYFTKLYTFTWPASQVTITLPFSLQQADLLGFEDITNTDPGIPVGVGGPLVFWKDNKTLQWSSDGPPETLTIRVSYLASPAKMVDDADEPDLIPRDYRELLAWSAACWMRTVGDEGIPQMFAMKLDELRMDYYKQIALGRPRGNIPIVQASNVSVPPTTDAGAGLLTSSSGGFAGY